MFNYVKEKVYRKLKHWNNKLISKAGKAVLLKSVAQTIPTYTMSCFLLPKSICQEIERLLNDFWWKSNSTNSKGIRWMAWNKMSACKTRGGLGFRDLYGSNIAMLGKQIWNFLHKPNSLVARVFKASLAMF